MAISFNSIPNLLLTPGAFFEYDNSRALSGLPPLPNRVVLIGGRLSTGTADAGVLKQITRESDGWSYFGLGSQLGAMCAAFKKASRFTEVWAIGVADAGGATASTTTITVTGTATSAGTYHLYIGGVKVDVPIALGDDADTAAGKIVTAVTDNGKLPTTAAVGGTGSEHIATLTTRHAGAFTADIDVRANFQPREDLAAPAGLTFTIATGTTGATDPSLAATLAAIGDEWFSVYVSGYNGDSNVDLIEAELETRWGPTVMQDGIAFYGMTETYADLSTAAGLRNSQFSVLCGIGLSPTPPWEVAAVVAAVSSNESDPARPRQTLTLPNVLPPAREARFTLEERNLLLQAGVATFTVDTTGNVAIERLVTTYTENADGIADASYRDLEIMLTLAALRYTSRARIRQKYPRHKLASDGAAYGVGQAVVTPTVLRAELIGLAEQWESNAWIESATAFAESLIVERNADDRDRVDAILGPDLVNGFRVFAGQIQFVV